MAQEWPGRVADDWPGTVAQDAPASDPWPGGVEPAPNHPQKPDVPVPLLDSDSIVRPIDGDTLIVTRGGRLRLPYVDAPELKQQGWDRQGNPVPIGQQSLDALTADIASGRKQIGVPTGLSYGRTVAPVSVDGEDLGLRLTADGNVILDPRHPPRDRQQRYDLSQAERLARQNFLGVHGTFHQTPQQYRADPSYQPAREEMARFWDTPTPNAGLSKEAEQGYLAVVNDRNSTARDIIAFAEANGARLNQAEVDDFVAKRNAGYKVPQVVTYRDAPKLLTDPGDGRTGAMVRGGGQGIVFNQLEEFGAIPDTFGLTRGRENVWNSDRRLADIFANNLSQNEAITGHDRAAYPTTTRAAEFGGALVVPMARVRSAADLAKWGAAYGGLTGLGNEGSIPERLTSGVIGTGTGLVTTVLGGKALEAASPYVVNAARRVMGLAGRRADVTPAGNFGDVLAETAPRTRDVIDIGPGEVPASPVPLGAGYLADNAQPLRAKDVLPSSNPDEQRAFVIGPDGKVHQLAVRHDEFRDALGREAQGYAEVTNYLDEFALRRPDNPTAAQLRTINELGVRGRHEGYSLTEGGAGGGLSPAMARQRDYLDIGESRPVAMDAEPGASVSQPVDRPSRMDQPITEAQLRARAENVEPRDVLPIMSNEVGSVEEAAAAQAGRYVEAQAPHERGELTRQTVRAWNGAEVPKVGPIDMVGWLRLRGGLKDQGGEVSHMGLDNSPRRMDFVGQEQRFGPLVNDESGLSLEDAAQRAFDAGYFPDLTEAPGRNQFLDALRSTYEGRGRRFLPEDQPQIDRFYGAQADRYALQEQRFETGEPIYTDKSVPADEPQPFPPPSAYEEWPAGGPDFAGNIRLEKLESPQDIKRALATTEKRVGFDAATRGRVTQAETEALAADLGMTPDKLLTRRKGQALNAEEALAARQILAKSGNELVNFAKRVQAIEEPGDDLLAQFRQAWMRHVAIQEQVAGATAEAGRALQQFRMAADSRAVRGDVLASLVNAGGGRHRIKEAADTLLEAVEAGPGVFNAVAEKAAKPRFADKLAELYINYLLSGPTTHVVNTVSNTLTSLAQIPEHAAAAVVGIVRKVAVRQEVERVTGGEVGQRLFGLLQGAKEGARMFATALRTGEPSDTFSKVQGQEFKAISGLKGEVIRVPTRLLTAEDEFFKGIARRMELNGLAARMAHSEGLRGEAAKSRIAELVANPTDDMIDQSLDYARYATFQRPLGPVASNISRLTRDAPWLRPIITFVRTPTNLLKFAAERSPAAPLLKEWRADIKAGGARRDLALARAMVGTGFGALIYNTALNGHITGSTPSDEAKARFMRAQGWQPYSLKLGDHYYSYSRLDPFATTIGVAADLATKAEGMTDRQLEDYTTLLVASIIKNMGDKTWLSGVSDFTEAISDPERHLPNYLRRLGASFLIPNVVTQTERAFDPVSRDTKSFGAELQSRIPGLSGSLPVKRDIWGEPIANELEGPAAVLSPVKPSTAKNDPVTAEMLRIGARFDVPQRFITKDGKRVDLTPEQYDRYSELAGKGSRQRIQALMAGPDWKGLSDDQKQERVRKAATAAKKAARESLFGEAGEREAGDEAWPGKIAAPTKVVWPGQVASQRDVVSNLLRIAGLSKDSLTSGYRTREYQADMKRRGYHPSDSSGHLDGSDLDIVVPPGRTMGWLMREVKRVEPEARLLPEGDHLHASFPGWYGAPVLGGAKAAGLRNPMAGR